MEPECDEACEEEAAAEMAADECWECWGGCAFASMPGAAEMAELEAEVCTLWRCDTGT